MKTVWLMIVSGLLLSGCATAPRVCPEIPPLALEVTDRDFQGEMESFLSGTLPPPASKAPISPSASRNTARSKKR